jgi:hypothetical protein
VKIKATTATSMKRKANCVMAWPVIERFDQG